MADTGADTNLDIAIDIEAVTVTVPVDLGIWREGQTLELRLDDPTPVGVFLDDLLRLLGLPLRTWEGEAIEYWLHTRGEGDDTTPLDNAARLNEIEVPHRGLVLVASDTAWSVRSQLEQMGADVRKDIRTAINDQIQKGIDEVTTAATVEITGVIRDIREQVTRCVTDLIPAGGRGVKAQFWMHVALRRVGNTDAWVEYQDAIEAGLNRAQRHARGVWRALSGVAAQAGTAGVAGATATEALDGPRGETGETGPPGGVAQGRQGNSGDPGVKGDPGPPGDPGVKGDSGDPGSPGDPGVKGDSGDPGPPGPVTVVPPISSPLTRYDVKPGDSLWFIAAKVCGEMPVRQLVNNVLAIWVTNLEVIGSNPSSIDVGQRLFIPCSPPAGG